jgi:hypothetical protein
VFADGRANANELLLESSYPVLFLDYPAFVYSRGLEYAVYNLTGASLLDPTADPAPHDWGRQDALFTDHPPATTRTILELDIDGGEPPVDIGLADVPAELADRLELDDWDRLGRFYVYLLLFPLHADLNPEALAATWVADRVLFLNDLGDGSTSLIWTSEWAADADAEAMEAALWQLHGRDPIKGDPPFRGLSTDGELVHLERRGARLVLARNVDAELLGPLIEGSFAGAEPAAARRKPSLPASIDRHRKRFDFARF